MRTSKMGSFCSEEREETVRLNSPGLLTRKPDKKAAFARKKAIQNIHPQSKYTPLTKGVSRQKRPNPLPTSTSLKTITTHLHDNIKYLSPKHAQSTLVIPHSAKGDNSYSPLINSTLHSTLDDMLTSEGIHTPSGISIDCLSGRNYALEGENSGRDWFGLQAENDRLKEENKSLKMQIVALKEELCSIQFSKICRSKGQSPKCRQCSSVKSQNKQLSSTLQQSKREIDSLKATIESLQSSLLQQHQTITLLSSQLTSSRQYQDKLQSLLESLKQKIQADSTELRYLSIQQDVLMRKKDELERIKSDNAKKEVERNHMKKIITQYKDKIDTLRKIVISSRTQKRILKEDVEITLELSLDSSINK